MVLAQQISYAMAVAPKLIPFRELLKEMTPWDCTDEIDNVFRETMTVPANNVEEGIRLFDPSRVKAILSDWCRYGLGHILLQKHRRGPPIKEGSEERLCCTTGWQVFMMGSRFAPTAEANYSSTEGELLAVADVLHTNKYFTLGCPKLPVGTDHKPLLGLLSNKDLDAIDKPRQINLFDITYIPEMMLGGHRYSVQIWAEALHSKPLLLDQDTDVIKSMSPTVKPVTCQEVNSDTSKDTYIVVLMNLGSSFPATNAELPIELQPYWLCRGELSMMVSPCTTTE